MPKYTVTVDVVYRKEITLHARDGDEAEERAVELASSWNNVHHADAVEHEEEK